MVAMSFGGIFFLVLLVIGVIALTMLIFGSIVLVKVVRLISRGIAGLLGMPDPRLSMRSQAASLRCPRSRCHAENHTTAKFCRRCGMGMNALAQRHPTEVRRTAMSWNRYSDPNRIRAIQPTGGLSDNQQA
ncbi:zinc ribbon domain-containing protein [Humisphaera borealis]|uniref:Zinc ribbon domain-containing protein n=1 Tax=Humisphaera borealis TaxID=2807512 RepID=A0A7M2WXZ6_9BACT|nr:zinc ribbon domain-containing protein [Humisphaera borealis]QOV90224.1 zinc ribbon domain-containing protein [Humisphaera borealis]